MSKALSRIKAIIGHTYTYQRVEHTVLDWSMDGDQLILDTDQQQIKLHLAHVPAFLLELEPATKAGEDALAGVELARVSSTPATTNGTPSEVDKMLPTSALAEINNALLDSIRKVQGDASYIPQAKAISNAVQVAVNVSKLQIEAAKLSMQAQRRK